MITKLCLRTAFTAAAYMTKFETINLVYQQEIIRQIRSIEDIQDGWSWLVALQNINRFIIQIK